MTKIKKPIYFRGMKIQNLHSYFDLRDGRYIEEFDTPDGQHWFSQTLPGEYTPEIRALAIQEGIIKE